MAREKTMEELGGRSKSREASVKPLAVKPTITGGLPFHPPHKLQEKII